MKKRFFLLYSLILFTVFACSENKSIKDKLVGEWKASAEDKNVSLIFKDSDHAMLILDNQAIGGEEYTANDGRKAECKFEIDKNVNPMSLDLVFYEKEFGEEQGRIEGIFRFLTDNKIEYRMSFTGKQPTEFNAENDKNTVILDKVTD